ncbi:50S ribosomal protein L6 [Gilvimarinus agarilyticus]|uniref:50S ribosomal protein L6 n=1 Tax=unclassified Gilvimarinus TaxID=2642066 RepID=UPI001C08D1CF|nr:MULTISPECIES: 50S ribosomal protein L6 [unclassified Gilvimarinus]MBU2885252.1 50S ribosomal protein L6 [Gilvimarinus agarilyticus]MDO6570149.1 50S ribosomal protein L6 [Gilvimarinus sp. 2_MG-2023]MDO6748316.1 50S ribosomal protein L6 [Gilvimarinus sp. 1_MG-2023]
MSRVANSPVEVPAAVKVTLDGQELSLKGSNGTLALTVHEAVEIKQEENVLQFAARDGGAKQESIALAGTMRALVNNMVKGVSVGFEKKLQLVGVGYRAKASGKSVNLSLGFSNPVDYTLPEGVTAETPSQTDIVLKSADNQLLGQVAAEIRALRPPEPYKGKGVRFADEQVRRKEAKKK